MNRETPQVGERRSEAEIASSEAEWKQLAATEGPEVDG
jgi:hypothetical protein